MEVVGRVITGNFGEITVRQKQDEEIELGDLLVVETEEGHEILQAFDLAYGSQLSDQVRNLVAGMKLEGHGENLEFMEPELNNYVVANLKNLVTVKNGEAKSPKRMPEFFSSIRRIQDDDLDFIKSPSDPLELGKIRSGSKELDVNVELPGEDVISHHVLIPASTGKGKSNLVKVLLYNTLEEKYCGHLVFDPHDEYYGRESNPGLSDHPKSGENLHFYTPHQPPVGERTLKINLNQIKPRHLSDVMSLSDAQSDAIYTFYREYRDDWIEEMMTTPENEEDLPDGVGLRTFIVLKRKFRIFLDIEDSEGEIYSEGIFCTDGGENTIEDISDQIEDGETVVVDTSSLTDKGELLVSVILAERIFDRYKRYKRRNELDGRPVVSMVIEEAPRVIGEQTILRSDNIFDTIAREGRKFKTGLIAVTQLPSVIPKEILANMNTKIILGIEMESERSAVIGSASQDLSKDSRTIASLDIGEAIVTSPFTKFAIPLSIPLFDEMVEEKDDSGEDVEMDYPGMES